MKVTIACEACGGSGKRGYPGGWEKCVECDGKGGEKVSTSAPCTHPGIYHLSKNGLEIVRPHPQANTCFARQQGYIIAKIEPFYKELGPAMVAGLNAKVEADKREDTACELDDEGDHEAAMLTRMGR